MRRQNPPQSHLDHAQEIEKYLRPLSIAFLYGIGGVCWVALVSLVFAALVAAAVLNTSPAMVTIFAIIAFVPFLFALLAWFLRPQDPVSIYIRSRADRWRIPIPVTPDTCTFKAQLGEGEIVSVRLSFYSPWRTQTRASKERLYTYGHAALAGECSTRTAPPTATDIEKLFDQPLERLAEEFHIPVLYTAIEDISTARDESTAMAYFATGTWN